MKVKTKKDNNGSRTLISYLSFKEDLKPTELSFQAVAKVARHYRMIYNTTVCQQHRGPY